MSGIAKARILITGGASGIGRLLAEKALAMGAASVMIWDRDEKALADAVESLQGKGLAAEGACIDLTDTVALVRLSEETLTSWGTPDILVNNAGIVVGKYFEEHSHEEVEWTMRVNTLAMMHVSKALLPAMMDAGKGHIVNIASSAGMAACPRLSVYVASKWAAIGWSESLRLELEERAVGIRVTTVTPYLISTGMFEGASSTVIPILKPEAVATRILKDVQRNRIFSRMPGIVYAMPFFHGILPQRWYDRILGKWFGIHGMMKDFRGRSQKRG